MGLNKLETFVSTITTNQQHLLHGEGKRPCKVAILIYVILVKTKLLEILSRAHCPCTAEDYSVLRLVICKENREDSLGSNHGWASISSFINGDHSIYLIGFF